MKKILYPVALGLLLATSAFAGKPYGAAGCGLGSLAMGKGGSQILAATTNGTSYSQIFGITSGTSNCTDDGTVKVAKRVPMFVETNRVSLASDIARGSGETVASLSEMVGCKNSGQFATTLQRNYKTIFPSEAVENEAVAKSILNVVKTDSELAGTCSVRI